MTLLDELRKVQKEKSKAEKATKPEKKIVIDLGNGNIGNFTKNSTEDKK